MAKKVKAWCEYNPPVVSKFLSNPGRYFQWDDGGRCMTGRYTPNNGVGDCVTRALVIAEDTDYDTMWFRIKDMCDDLWDDHEFNVYVDRNKLIDSLSNVDNVGGPDEGVLGFYVDYLLYRHSYVKVKHNYASICVSLLEEFPNCVISTVGHLAAVKNGALRDNWFSWHRKDPEIFVKDPNKSKNKNQSPRLFYPEPTTFKSNIKQQYVNGNNYTRVIYQYDKYYMDYSKK